MRWQQQLRGISRLPDIAAHVVWIIELLFAGDDLWSHPIRRSDRSVFPIHRSSGVRRDAIIDKFYSGLLYPGYKCLEDAIEKINRLIPRPSRVCCDLWCLDACSGSDAGTLNPDTRWQLQIRFEKSGVCISKRILRWFRGGYRRFALPWACDYGASSCELNRWLNLHCRAIWINTFGTFLTWHENAV